MTRYSVQPRDRMFDKKKIVVNKITARFKNLVYICF